MSREDLEKHIMEMKEHPSTTKSQLEAAIFIDRVTL